ncbi:hypothetical protein [Microbacterium panaciterrae]|uniref:MFS transporter n=1 Tax=Microbacterium panaciterrae TaxID=985759 RepID=A0ABP8P527_9MICO
MSAQKKTRPAALVSNNTANSVARIVRPVGWVLAALMGALDDALRIHLAL